MRDNTQNSKRSISRGRRRGRRRERERERERHERAEKFYWSVSPCVPRKSTRVVGVRKEEKRELGNEVVDE